MEDSAHRLVLLSDELDFWRRAAKYPENATARAEGLRGLVHRCAAGEAAAAGAERRGR